MSSLLRDHLLLEGSHPPRPTGTTLPTARGTSPRAVGSPEAKGAEEAPVKRQAKAQRTRSTKANPGPAAPDAAVAVGGASRASRTAVVQALAAGTTTFATRAKTATIKAATAKAATAKAVTAKAATAARAAAVTTVANRTAGVRSARAAAAAATAGAHPLRKQAGAGPAVAEPATGRPASAKSPAAGAATAKSPAAKPAAAKPAAVKAATVKAVTVKLATAKPAARAASVASTAKAAPVGKRGTSPEKGVAAATPAAGRTGAAESKAGAAVKPAGGEPATLEPAVVEQVAAEPTAKPAAAKAVAKPAAVKSPVAKPAAVKSPVAKPAVAESAATKPATEVKRTAAKHAVGKNRVGKPVASYEPTAGEPVSVKRAPVQRVPGRHAAGRRAAAEQEVRQRPTPYRRAASSREFPTGLVPLTDAADLTLGEQPAAVALPEQDGVAAARAIGAGQADRAVALPPGMTTDRLPRFLRRGSASIPRRPALCLAAAMVGAISLSAFSIEEPTGQATGTQVVSVAEQLGIEEGTAEVLADDATQRLGELAISRNARDAAQAAAAEAQLEADRLAAEAAAEAARPKAVMPVQGARLTSSFGPRWGTLHAGVDLAAPMHTPEFAVMDGIVIEAGPAAGFGLAVYIQHENGDVTVYGHMDKILVEAGQVVRAGDTIALLGNRGQSTGPHLHFEVHVGGLDGQKVDPLPWLRQQGVGI